MMRIGIQPCMRSETHRACESFLKAGQKKSGPIRPDWRCPQQPELTECYHRRVEQNTDAQQNPSPATGNWKLDSWTLTQYTEMRLAWFSPMPPVPSGIAACSAELVAELAEASRDRRVRARRPDRTSRCSPGIREPGDRPVGARLRLASAPNPYDLTVYQIGNSSHHDYIWPYLFRYPGLTVLHDAHLHHARAAALLRTNTAADDFRARVCRQSSRGRRPIWPSSRSPDSTITSITTGR